MAERSERLATRIPSSPRHDVLNACAVRAQKVDRMIFWIRVTGRNAQDRIEVAAEEFNDVEWGARGWSMLMQ